MHVFPININVTRLIFVERTLNTEGDGMLTGTKQISNSQRSKASQQNLSQFVIRPPLNEDRC